jgi:hypothetical protein
MKTITGGCLCGAVKYQAQGEPLFAVYCHCRDCQRASGAGHVPVLGMPKPRFKTSGATTSYIAAAMNGRRSVRHFCPTCGSLLFGTSDAAPDAVSIYVGTLDDSSVFEPAAVMFTRDRARWDATAQDLPEFHTMPQPPAADAG